jgi:hypothetical protein
VTPFESFGADCESTSAEVLGKELGSVYVQQAKDFAKVGTRGWIDCDDAEDSLIDSENTLDENMACAHVSEALKVTMKIVTASEDGCLNEHAPYSKTMDFFMFRTLLNAIKLGATVERWHLLGRIFGLCDSPSSLTRAGREACGGEVAAACVAMLEEDRDPLNRQLALEILVDGYVREAARQILQQIAASPSMEGERCPSILEQGDKSETDYFDQLGKQYREGKAGCEGKLAQRALQVLSEKRQ